MECGHERFCLSFNDDLKTFRIVGTNYSVVLLTPNLHATMEWNNFCLTIRDKIK